MTVETTTRQSEAHGGHCPTCDQWFNITTSPFWHWSKSVALHRNGSGHKVTLYRIAR